MKIKILFLCALSTATILSACGGGGGGGVSCGAGVGNICPEGQYCNFDDFACGENGKSGHCTEIPVGCELAPIENVCSCEGISFFNDCYAAQAGQSVRSIGDCAG